VNEHKADEIKWTHVRPKQVPHYSLQKLKILVTIYSSDMRQKLMQVKN